ncbi:hypothetical protein BCR32DRAFT_196914, partial [Anaeromyces robustus]
DTKLFVILCQALNIPVITEDSNLNIKKCGFRSDEHIKKLQLIEKIFRNRYV